MQSLRPPEDLKEKARSALQWLVISAGCLFIGASLLTTAFLTGPGPKQAASGDKPEANAEANIQPLKGKPTTPPAPIVPAKPSVKSPAEQKEVEDPVLDAKKKAREADIEEYTKLECNYALCFHVYSPQPKNEPSAFDFHVEDKKCAEEHKNCTMMGGTQEWIACVKKLQNALGLTGQEQDGKVGPGSSGLLSLRQAKCNTIKERIGNK